MKTTKFWMVVRSEPQWNGPGPKRRHETWADAAQEAERLAIKEGFPFIILEAVDEVIPVVQAPVIRLERLELAPQEAPVREEPQPVGA